MAESQKEAPSSADPKQKTLLLDEGIGREFLSFWKSMSMAEGDPMDFDFDTGAKGKTTAFNFSKMDMNFNFDGDFGKLSSFKVDMSDLEFSPKKTGKSKERSGEESVSRNHQGKKDNFTFSFDFNDLDTFNLEPSLTKAEKKSSKGVSADNPVAEDIGALDDGIAMKLTGFEMATNFKADSLVGGPGDLDSINDNGTSETAQFENRSLTDEARTYEKKVMFSAEETAKHSPSPEKTISADPYDHQRILDIPVQSTNENETNGTVSELNTKNFSQDPKVNNISGGEQIVNAKMIAEKASNHECSQFDNSPPLHTTTSQSEDAEMNKLGCGDHIPSENVDGTQLEICGFEDIVSRKAPYDIEAGSENKNSASELTFTPLSSGKMLDKSIPFKEEAAGAIRSKYFMRTEQMSQLHQASSTQTKVLSLGSKRIGAVHLVPADEKREEFDANDAPIGEKLVDGLSSQTPELAKGEPVFLRSGKNVQDVNSTDGDLYAVRSQSRISKLVSTSRPHVQEVTRSEPVLLGSERSVKDLNVFSLQVDLLTPSKQIAKLSSQKCENPRSLVPNKGSIQKLKTISVERNKLLGLKALNRTPKPSGLKLSRATEGTILVPVKQTGTKMVPSIETQKKTPSTPSLKRKTLEQAILQASNANADALNPLKRLSDSPSESRLSKSPSESRMLKEASEAVLKEQVCNQENPVHMNTKNVLNAVPDIPGEVNMSELDITLVMESDQNVKKAEGYTKDLEDICNMLKKKHDEAKDILVRAIVNNNNLLMINHPMYEAKIHAIQKFAAGVMSKKLQV